MWSRLKEVFGFGCVFSSAGSLLVSETAIGRSNAVYIQSPRALAAVLMSEINILCFSIF